MQKYTPLFICSMVLCSSLSAQLINEVASLTRSLGDLQKFIAEPEVKPPPKKNGNGGPKPPPIPPGGGPPPPPKPPTGGPGPSKGKPITDEAAVVDMVRVALEEGKIDKYEGIGGVEKYLKDLGYAVTSKRASEILNLAEKPGKPAKPSTGEGDVPPKDEPKKPAGPPKEPMMPSYIGTPGVGDDEAIKIAKKAISDGKITPLTVSAVMEYLHNEKKIPESVKGMLTQGPFEKKIKDQLLPTAPVKPATGSQAGTAEAAIAAIEAEITKTGKSFKNMFAVSNFLDSNKLRPTTVKEQELLNEWLRAQGY